MYTFYTVKVAEHKQKYIMKTIKKDCKNKFENKYSERSNEEKITNYLIKKRVYNKSIQNMSEEDKQKLK